MNKKLLIKQSLALLDQNKAKLNNPTFARLQFEIVNKNIQSVKKINDQLQLLNNIDAKKMTFKQFTDLKEVKPLNESQLTLTIKERDYQPFTHDAEIRKVKKDFPNSLIVHTVKYYINDQSILENEQYKYDAKNFAVSFFAKDYNKTMYDSIIMSNGNSAMTTEEYLWRPTYFIKQNTLKRDGKKYTVKLTTTAYNPLEVSKSTLDKQEAKQLYKLNDNGTCVYDAFLSFFQSKLDAKPKDFKLKSFYNKLIDNRAEYAIGYTDDTIHKIGELVQTSIHIVDLVNGNNKVINEQPTNRYTIHFINSKYNHLDLLHNPNDADEVDKDEYYKIKNESEFYIERGGKLYTNKNTYAIKYAESSFNTLYNKWKKDVDYDKLYLDTNDESYKLISNYDYSLHTFFNEYEINNDLYEEIDQIKSYFNVLLPSNPHYLGVPSGSFITFKCTDDFDDSSFDKMTNNRVIGYFHVKIINHCSSNKTSDRLGFTIGSEHVLTSPQINYLKKFITFKYINCSVAPSVDIPFSEDMKNKENDIKHYCKAFGLMLKIEDQFTTTIKPYNEDVKYYKIINNDNKQMFLVNGVIKIIEKNSVSKSYVHIAYFMNSYCKTNNLKVMYEDANDIDDVFGCKVDAVVFKKGKVPKTFDRNIFTYDQNKVCKVEFIKPHQREEDIITEDPLDYGINITIDYFRPLYKEITEQIKCSNIFWSEQSNEILTNSTICLTGKGGSGKTYSILNSNLISRNIIYSSMCWNLITGQQEKNKSKDFMGLSIPKITPKQVGEKNKSTIYEGKNAKYIIIDEATLINDKDILAIRKRYYYCFIFIVGDIKNDKFYQCSIPSIKVINPLEHNIQQVEYTKSYRFDREQNNRLDILRNKMNELYDDNDRNEKIQLFTYELYNDRLFNKYNINYRNIDVGISSTNNKCDDLTNYYIEHGAKAKYYIKKTDLYNGHIKGQELDNKPDHKNYEMKLFKTIHSFQGLDLSNDNNIIIDFRFNFDFQLCYTALSRARRIDQIYIIYGF